MQPNVTSNRGNYPLFFVWCRRKVNLHLEQDLTHKLLVIYIQAIYLHQMPSLAEPYLHVVDIIKLIVGKH